MNSVARLEAWYRAQCDGTWEHQHGVHIDTLDNPGWSVKIDLVGTPLLAREFQAIDLSDPSDASWLYCRKQAGVFEGFGSPNRLDAILTLFLDWAEFHS